MSHMFDAPMALQDSLRWWGDGGRRLSLDEVDIVGKMYGGEVADWSDRILAAVNATMPRTNGVAYLDDEDHIVGVGLTSGIVAGQTTDAVITDVSREDACFVLRAFGEGYRRVRPAGLPPVAILLAAAEAATEESSAVSLPSTDARVFVEVDPDNRAVVFDVWAVAPSGGAKDTGGVGIWRRHAGQWQPDPAFFSLLKGEQVPTLLHMAPEDALLASVMEQVDASTQNQPFEPMVASGPAPDAAFFADLMPLVAAGNRGGLKRAAKVGKGGNAETLRRYWAEGEGAAKIRWGQGGDFYRCVKHLRKYMGTRAKGYCNLIHKRALGYYPSTHAKMVKDAKKG